MTFRIPVVKKSCCGCSLETGTKIIGFIHIFLIGGLFLAAFILNIIDEYISDVFNDTFNAVFFRNEFMQMTVIGNVAFSATLIYGTFKRDSVYFEPWLILKTADIGLSIFNVGTLLVIRILGHKVLDLLLQLINIGLLCYMFIVVYSLYKEIKPNVPR